MRLDARSIASQKDTSAGLKVGDAILFETTRRKLFHGFFAGGVISNFTLLKLLEANQMLGEYIWEGLFLLVTFLDGSSFID